MSLARTIADPRNVRIQRILNSNVMDLKITKATLLNILPTSEYDLYLSSLRSAAPPMRQVGVPNDLDFRDVDTNTEEITYVNKEVQCFYGDDTQFYNTLNSIAKKNSGLNKGTSSLTEGKDSNETTQGNGATNTNRSADSDGTSTAAGVKLSEFLQRSSLFCETILIEQSRKYRDAGNQQNDRETKLLSASWEALGSDAKNGANEFIRLRKTIVARFSRLQPSQLLCCHPYPLGEKAEMDDLRPRKGLFSVWDAISPSGPSFLLEASGQPTACCFSVTQSTIVVGGTTDGCLHLWDLRESASVHKDKDSIEMGVSRGVRKPSYSTHLQLSFAVDISTGEEEDAVHTTGIVQIESIGGSNKVGGGGNATVSQFVSLDEAGVLIFWVTHEQGEGGIENLRRSPWSRVSLIPTRKLASNRSSLSSNPSAVNTKSGRRRDDTSAAISSLFGDTSQSLKLDNTAVITSLQGDGSILLGDLKGQIKRLSRIGEAPAPKLFDRSHVSTIIETNTAMASSSSQNLEFCPKVTCMSLRECHSEQGLLLVGRSDDTVDLFSLDASSPLLTWSLGSAPIVHITWVDFSPASFLVVDGRGGLHHFDLFMDLYRPFRTESLGLTTPLVSRIVDISQQRSHVDYVYIVCPKQSTSGKSCNIAVRAINVGDMVQPKRPSPEEEARLMEALYHSTAHAADTKKILFRQSGGGSSSLNKK